MVAAVAAGAAGATVVGVEFTGAAAAGDELVVSVGAAAEVVETVEAAEAVTVAGAVEVVAGDDLSAAGSGTFCATAASVSMPRHASAAPKRIGRRFIFIAGNSTRSVKRPVSRRAEAKKRDI